MPAQLRWRRRTLDGRAAWQLENDRICLDLFEGGGHIAAIELKGKRPPAGINPLWKPPWRTIEPHEFSMEKHGRVYGKDSEARLLSGIRGHNVCFDYWCGPSAEEMAAGLSFHGEAGLIRWRLRRARVTRGELQFTCAAEMRLSAARLTRTVRLRPDETVAYIEETVENLTALDRPIGWVQHVTLGPPFVKRGRTRLDMPGARGYSLAGGTGRVPDDTEFQWPFLRAAAATAVDLRVAAPEERSGFNLAVQLEPGRETAFLAAATPELRLLIAYVFSRADFPWVNVWEQNRQSTASPWKGRTLAVGLEFGNTIVPGSRQAMAAFPPEKFGVPTYGWLGARASRTVRYCALLAEVPADYRGTADIRTGAKGLSIIETDQAREFFVPCERLT